MIDKMLAQDVFDGVGENVLFVTLALNHNDLEEEREAIQRFAHCYPAILRSMRIRFINDNLKVSVGFSYKAWSYLFHDSLIPKELKTFEGIQNNNGTMPSTEGDIFIHIRADRVAITYEVQRQFTEILKSVTHVVDETKGFRYFEGRSIIGFVDGTESPTGQEAMNYSLIDSNDDPIFANGSYVFVQKWYHDMEKWHHMSLSMQEKGIGRNKWDDIELPESDKYRNAHNVAAHLEEDGEEKKIIRMNVPYSSPAYEDTGTFFIGYSNHLTIIDNMLHQMMNQDDFLLTFSKILSGQFYFVPSFNILEQIADGLF